MMKRKIYLEYNFIIHNNLHVKKCMWLLNWCPEIFLFWKVLRGNLIHAIRKKRPELYRRLDSIIFHQDNAPAHTAVQTQLEIELLGFEWLQHPPYSPNLAPMDFAVFPKLKSALRGIKFNDFGELKQATLNAVRSLDTDWCQSVFDKWVAHHKKCVRLDSVNIERE